jgi:chorismate dehydratase
MSTLRVGAVGYLNARPLVYGLDGRSGRIAVRFDVPSRCAALLHDRSIDVGLIPSIEYLHRSDYRLVPGVGVVSDGPVASVALYTSKPVSAVARIALDSSSRTSVALLKVLCAAWFGIAPAFVTAPPDLASMVRDSDAALVIGDPALLVDHRALGLEKIDLGQAWTTMTGLPFVYACWTGWPGALGAEDVAVLQDACAQGILHLDEIGRSYFGSDVDKGRIAVAYLKENIKYNLGEREHSGLLRFYEMAAAIGLVPPDARLRFYGMS